MKRGGLLLRVGDQLSFVAAATAVHVAPPPRITPIPGAPPDLLGIALYAGAIVPVLAIGPERGEMVVCQHSGELVGIVGGRVVKTGSFDVVPDRPELVEYRGERASALELASLWAQVQAAGIATPARTLSVRP
jgi:hypothetical protein